MLTLLQIRNFAIIESLDLELHPGFSAVTGETGAGKSIMVDALQLLLGGRADTSTIRAGADKAELTAEFTLDQNPSAQAWLREAALDDDSTGTDDVCLLRRVIADSGRSRAWINGTTVTLAQMLELGEHLVEIHGQHEHLRLLRKSEQFNLLDAGDHHTSELQQLDQAFKRWQKANQALRELDSETTLTPADLDLLKFQIDELESSVLTPAALAELEAEHQLLARGSDVVSSLQYSLDALEEDEIGIAHRLQDLLNRLGRDAALDRDIANAEKALQEAAINCEEARSTLQGALSRINLSPARLEELDDVLGQLHALGRKHRTEPGLLAGVLERLQQRFDNASSLEQRRQQLEQEVAVTLDDYRAAARELHALREVRAGVLAEQVTELMQGLGMEGGRFNIDVVHEPERPPNRRGDDRLDFMVSANPGMPLAPLRKVASGGELSRISLAIKVAAASDQAAPTQVFDEVDAGIGGDTANAVGQLLRSLAENGQALCVTHLAQVAVCANHQFRVIKHASSDATRVDTEVLDEHQRIDEIARMLGGKVTDQSRAHASELLTTGK